MNNEIYNGIGNCYPFKARCWETKDHHIIKISEMTTSHIKNVIKFLERNNDFYDMCGGDYWEPESYYYEDYSFLVHRKIEELEKELSQRKNKEDISW